MLQVSLGVLCTTKLQNPAGWIFVPLHARGHCRSHIKQSIGVSANICLRLEERDEGLLDKKGISVSLDTLNHCRVS